MKIGRMTPRRWQHFMAYVPIGSEVRAVREDVILWHGVMLENYPYDKEEFFDRECGSTRCLRRVISKLHKQPILRYQNFKSRDEGTFLLSPPKWHVDVQYLSGGQWLNLDQILALPAVRL